MSGHLDFDDGTPGGVRGRGALRKFDVLARDEAVDEIADPRWVECYRRRSFDPRSCTIGRLANTNVATRARCRCLGRQSAWFAKALCSCCDA